MAKQKSRGLTATRDFEDIKMSSGVMIRVLPFPLGIYEKIQANVISNYSDPIPPKKTIQVVDGEEEVDDLTDPVYLAEKERVDREKKQYTAEHIMEHLLDFCLEILPGLDHYESTIARLEKLHGQFPVDPYDRRREFIKTFAVAKKSEYERLAFASLSLSLIDDPEVAERLRVFRGDLARSADIEPDASGPDEDERLEVQLEIEGT